MNQRKLLGIITVAAIFGLPLPGNAAQSQLRLGATTATSSLIMFVAVDKGFFSKHGIDVKLFVRNTGPELSKSLDAGEIDFAPAAITNIPVALERGLNVRAVVNYIGNTYSSETDDNTMGIVVRGNSGINSIADLKGKKLGSTFGTGSDLYLLDVMKKNGIPTSALERVNVPQPSMASLLEAGGVHGMVGWEPYVTIMLDRVKESRVLIRGGGHTCFCGSLHGKPDILAREPRLVQAFVDALAEAAKFARDPKNLDENAQIATRYIRGLNADIVKRTHRFWTYDARLGTNTFKAFNRSVDMLIEQKKMKKAYDPARYYDLTYIKRTMERHPEWFSDLPK